MKSSIFVTGASGTVGSKLSEQLLERGHLVKGAHGRGKTLPSHNNLTPVVFDFTDPSTWEKALENVSVIFLMRPPHISNIQRDMRPFLEELKRRNLEQVIFMSVQGVEKNRWVPHHKVEKACEELDLPSTFIRPSFFMQNLITSHLSEIRDENQLFIPAGHGRTNFIDAEDIAEVIVRIVEQKELRGKAYTITGAASFSYQEVAEVLSSALEREIVYANPGPLAFLRYHHRKGRPLGMSLVMLVLYSLVKFGKSDITTSECRDILGREPGSLESFIRRNLHLYSKRL
jgi:uncharacterized protein YbjT (DUF2867 family)